MLGSWLLVAPVLAPATGSGSQLARTVVLPKGPMARIPEWGVAKAASPSQ